MILADYTCPACDADIEMMVESPAPDVATCPDCGGPASWLPSPVHGRLKIAEVQRGAVQKPPSSDCMDTRELGEGMPLAEWKKKRAAWRLNERRKRLKEQLA